MLKYHFRIKKEKTGYSAECIELKGCRTQGETQKELETNMAESLDLYLDEPSSSKDIFPLPDNSLTNKQLKLVEVDINVAFAMVLRQERIKNKMTQKEVAQKLGYSSITAYRKLEDSRFSNPSIRKIQQLKKVLPNLPVLLIA